MPDEPTVTQTDYWAQIPEWVLFHPDLSDKDVRVFAAFQRYAGASAECWPGIPKLAARLSVSDRTIQRSIDSLAKVGAVQVRARFVEGRQTSNAYRLVMSRRGDKNVTGGGVRDVTQEVEPYEREKPSTPRDNSQAPPSAMGAKVLEVILRAARQVTPGVTNPKAWEAAVKGNWWDAHGAEVERLAAKYPDAPPDMLASAALGESNALRLYQDPEAQLQAALDRMDPEARKAYEDVPPHLHSVGEL